MKHILYFLKGILVLGLLGAFGFAIGYLFTLYPYSFLILPVGLMMYVAYLVGRILTEGV